MNDCLKCCGFYLFLGLLTSSTAFASVIDLEDDTFWVRPGANLTYWIDGNDLIDNDSGVALGDLMEVRDAIHGDVAWDPVSEGFNFTPNAEFWSLGTDQFVYGVAGQPDTATVRLLHRFPEKIQISGVFDIGSPQGYTAFGSGGASVDELAAAAIVGSAGLRAVIPASDVGGAYAEYDRGGDTTDDGGSTLLGCGFGNLPGGGLGIVGVENTALLTAGPDLPGIDDTNLRVVLRKDSTLPKLRIELRNTSAPGDTFVESAWIDVPRDEAKISVQWWATGAILEVDGETAVISGVPNAILDFEKVRVGLMPVGTGSAVEIDLDFDEFRTYGFATTPLTPILRAESFESGTTPVWSQSHGSSLSIGNGGLTGEHDLVADLSAASSFLVDTSPDQEESLGIRFRVDTSDMTMAVSDSLRIFDSGSAADSLFGAPDFSMRLVGGANDKISLVVYSHRNGALVTSLWKQLTGEHTVELQFRTSASDIVSTGLIRVWVDGVLISEIESLDNDSHLVDWIRLGAMGVDAGTSGDLFLDDFEVWARQLGSLPGT